MKLVGNTISVPSTCITCENLMEKWKIFYVNHDSAITTNYTVHLRREGEIEWKVGGNKCTHKLKIVISEILLGNFYHLKTQNNGTYTSRYEFRSLRKDRPHERK